MNATTPTPVTAAADAADESAELWHEFNERLRAFVAQRVNDPHDVEDIVQNIFLRAHRHLTELRDSDKTTAWIFQIARNAIIDHYRAAPRRREQPAEQFDDRPGTPSPEQQLDDQELLRQEITGCLRPLLDQLPRTFREALELTDLGGMQQNEAARHLGLSVSGMKSRVQRGRAELHRMLLRACDLELDPRGGPITCQPSVRAPW